MGITSKPTANLTVCNPASKPPKAQNHTGSDEQVGKDARDENPHQVPNKPVSLGKPITEKKLYQSPNYAVAAISPDLSIKDALEIFQICALAGRQELIAGFLEGGLSPDIARERLLANKAGLE